MNIGDVSERSGLPPKTIRYYEDIGLVQPARSDNGYRSFAERDVYQLAFLSRARSLGFSVNDCRALLELYNDRERESAEVKRLAREHLQRIEVKIAELESMRATLSDLVTRCHGDSRPDCPILEGLASVERSA